MSKKALALCLTFTLVFLHLAGVVRGQTTASFALQRWATQQGNMIGGMLWFDGDFNGDGKDDLATVWNDAGQLSMDVQASTGTGFTLQRWATKQGNLIGGMQWFVGDFDGDGRDDLVTLIHDRIIIYPQD